VPQRRAAAPHLRIDPNIARETWSILRYAYGERALRLPLWGISWFWLIGIAYLAQFPNFAKELLGANNEVVTLFLTLFSIGIGAGSILCARLQRGAINLRLVPLGALGLTLFGFDFYLTTPTIDATGPLIGVSAFLATPAHWRIVVDLAVIAMAGGIYCVPLYAVMQAESAPEHRARVIAANNIVNALFMVAAGAVSALLLMAGLGIASIFLAVAIGNAVVTVWVTFAR
jgi:acyl-[acyl-carrier-protein]-phospholipid O-acyltransferase/long-chain-fatty-acid--[acyl-carrier-protein] ligase